jgi:hypothetical protein
LLEISALVIVLPPLPFPLPLFVVLATLKFRATSLLFVRAALLLEPPIVLIAAPLQVFVPALLTEATLLLLLPLLLLLSLLFPLPPLFGAFLVLALPISVPLAVVSTPLLLLLSSLPATSPVVLPVSRSFADRGQRDPARAQDWKLQAWKTSRWQE